MSHKTEIVKYEKIPDTSLIAIHVHCCGEHEHRHTVGVEVLSSPAKLKKSLKFAHEQAAKNHAAKKNEVLLEKLLGKR